MKLNMEFFNNKRLLIILSGVASIMIAFVIFVMSLIGFGNISAFMFGSKDTPELTTGPSATGSSITPSQQTPSVPPTNTEYTNTYTENTATQPTANTASQDTQIPSQNPQTTNPDSSIPDTSTASSQPVEIKVTGIKINPTGPVKLQTGDQLSLSYTVTPSNAVNYRIEWLSNNESVAFVSSNGTVKAVSTTKASTWITVRCISTTENNVQLAMSQIQINVEPKTVPVDLVKIGNTAGNTTIYVGDTLDLVVDISPSNATNKNESWNSSNTSVATVSNRKVTAKAPGKTIITVTVDGKKDSIEITVLDNTTEPPTDPGTQ